MPRSSETAVPTPEGLARLVTTSAPRPRATLVLGHGAGGGVQARDLAALADALPPRGVSVVRVEQPWRVAGRRVATAPARLDIAWRTVLTGLRPTGPLVVGGRSAGARVACRTARDVGADGVVALAFPLHPPGRPERSRAHELAVDAPLLVVQGERDAFGRPDELPAGTRVHVVPGADHGFAVRARGPMTQEEALTSLTEAVASWVEALAG